MHLSSSEAIETSKINCYFFILLALPVQETLTQNQYYWWFPIKFHKSLKKVKCITYSWSMAFVMVLVYVWSSPRVKVVIIRRQCREPIVIYVCMYATAVLFFAALFD